MGPSVHRVLQRAAALATALILGGCASALPAWWRAPAKGGGSDAASSAPPSPSTAPAPSTRPAFDTVVKDAQLTEGGALPVWRRDDRTWLEVPAEALGKPFYLSPHIATGIGEAGLFGGLLAGRWGSFGKPQLVEFRRVGNQIQMLAVNAAYSARPGTASRYAVQSSYSPSLLGSVPVLSSPHPQRNSVLIDAQQLFVNDLLGLSIVLNRAYRQSYSFDRGNSTIASVRAGGGVLWLDVNSHFQASSLAPPVAGLPGSPQTPGALPDARSLFVTTSYALTRLPDVPMRARKADPRVGTFTTAVADFSDDLERSPLRHFVNRWRLVKQDDTAAVSEPVVPITYWLDRSIPPEYREAVQAGVLEWNKAFERIGFRNAIRVNMPDDKDPLEPPADARAVIRWMTNSSPLFGAIGPSHVDPRSGEILRADIGLESLSSRAIRALRTQILTTTPPPASRPAAGARDTAAPLAGEPGPDACHAAEFGAEQLTLALDALDATGGIDPDSPLARQFVLAYLKETTMHEVGHTLGLRHNFRASRWLTQAQLADAAYTLAHGNSASVMEYGAINLPAPGAPMTTPFQATLGPYDYWAIEYAYRPLPNTAAPGSDPVAAAREEDALLLAIAARAQDPAQRLALDYGTDEDYFGGFDPDSLQFDLGRDPIAFARLRLRIVEDLIARLPRREFKPGEDYSVLRRSVSYAARELGRVSQTVARQIGGVRTLRDHPGSGLDPLQALPDAEQRAALAWLIDEFLARPPLRLPPGLERRLAPDYLERSEGSGSPAYSVSRAVLELQRGVLAPLMRDDLFTRMLDNLALAPGGAAAADTRGRGNDARSGARQRRGLPAVAARFTPQELHTRLAQAVWQGFERDAPAQAWRRNLQRDHVNRMAALVPAAPGQPSADARSFIRARAVELAARLRAAQRRTGAQPEQRAHWRDCEQTLRRALDAVVTRGTP